MAITTLAELIAGSLPPYEYHKVTKGTGTLQKTYWDSNGAWAAGTYDTTMNGVVCNSSTTGAFTWREPSNASAFSYLARFEAHTGPIGGQQLCDRLWHNGAIDVTNTSAQAIVTPAWPARDINGSSNGDGVFISLDCTAAMGAAAPTITISYTNSDGTSGRTGALLQTTANSSTTIQASYVFGLQAGDRGVKSVESITLSTSWLSGNVALVAFRPLAWAPTNLSSSSVAGVWEAAACGPVRLYSNSCLYIRTMSSGGSNTNIMGQITIAHG